MKYVVTVIAATLLFSTVFAGDVTIRMNNSSEYDVYIDGRSVKFQNSRNNRITLSHLSNGQHRVEVYKSNRYDRNDRWNRTRDRSDDYRKKGRLVHSSRFRVRPQTDVYITIDNKGRAVVDERSRSYNDRDRDRDRRRDYGYDNRGSYGSNSAMSSYDFNELKQKIRSQWFGKLSYAKNAIGQNYFHTGQVRELLEMFSSEDDRLELAKLSYSRTVDRGNFRQLYQLFSYQSQRELDRFIDNYRF